MKTVQEEDKEKTSAGRKKEDGVKTGSDKEDNAEKQQKEDQRQKDRITAHLK